MDRANLNRVPAEALSPELITLENGHQIVRIALRTETGTIVYADLGGSGEAQVYAARLGRVANAASAHNAGRPPATGREAEGEHLPNQVLRTLRDTVRRQGGTWSSARFFAEAGRVGVRLLDELEAEAVMRELVERGVLRDVGPDRYVVA